MTTLACQRKSRRIQVETPVMLEDFRTGFYYDGVIYNYSTDGAYLESDYAPRPGRKIQILFEDASEIFASDTYRAEIRWRRPLFENTSDFEYGIGVKYF